MRAYTKAPLHPGRILKHDYIEPLSLSVVKLAAYLGVSKKTLYRIVNEQSAITPNMALRLAQAFQTTPGLWLNMQKEFDLWQAQHESEAWSHIQPLHIESR